MSWLARSWQVIVGLLIVVYLAALPFVQTTGLNLSLLFLTFLYVTLALAWNLIGGYAGQTSFGHAAFYGIGAYTTGILWQRGVNPLLTIPLAGPAAPPFFLFFRYPP